MVEFAWVNILNFYEICGSAGTLKPFTVKEAGEIIWTVVMLFFIAVVLYGQYVIGYFFYLRFRGIISSGYKITRSAFDHEIARTNDHSGLRKLHYGKRIYLVFFYAFLIAIALVLLTMLVFGDP